MKGRLADVASREGSRRGSFRRAWLLVGAPLLLGAAFAAISLSADTKPAAACGGHDFPPTVLAKGEQTDLSVLDVDPRRWHNCPPPRPSKPKPPAKPAPPKPQPSPPWPPAEDSGAPPSPYQPPTDTPPTPPAPDPTPEPAPTPPPSNPPWPPPEDFGAPRPPSHPPTNNPPPKPQQPANPPAPPPPPEKPLTGGQKAEQVSSSCGSAPSGQMYVMTDLSDSSTCSLIDKPPPTTDCTRDAEGECVERGTSNGNCINPADPRGPPIYAEGRGSCPRVYCPGDVGVRIGQTDDGRPIMQGGTFLADGCGSGGGGGGDPTEIVTPADPCTAADRADPTNTRCYVPTTPTGAPETPDAPTNAPTARISVECTTSATWTASWTGWADTTFARYIIDWEAGWRLGSDPADEWRTLTLSFSGANVSVSGTASPGDEVQVRVRGKVRIQRGNSVGWSDWSPWSDWSSWAQQSDHCELPAPARPMTDCGDDGNGVLTATSAWPHPAISGRQYEVNWNIAWAGNGCTTRYGAGTGSPAVLTGWSLGADRVLRSQVRVKSGSGPWSPWSVYVTCQWVPLDPPAQPAPPRLAALPPALSCTPSGSAWEAQWLGWADSTNVEYESAWRAEWRRGSETAGTYRSATVTVSGADASISGGPDPGEHIEVRISGRARVRLRNSAGWSPWSDWSSWSAWSADDVWCGEPTPPPKPDTPTAPTAADVSKPINATMLCRDNSKGGVDAVASWAGTARRDDYVEEYQVEWTIDRPDEPYIDTNTNGQWDSGETYTDLDGDGSWTAAAAVTTREWPNVFPYLGVGLVRVDGGTFGFREYDELSLRVPARASWRTSVTNSAGTTWSDWSTWSPWSDWSDASASSTCPLPAPPPPLECPPDAGAPYTDTDGNGQWDPGEPYLDTDGDSIFDAIKIAAVYPPGYPEPYIDSDGDGSYTAGEPFFDSNGDGRWNTGERYFDSDGDGSYTAGDHYTDLDGDGSYTPDLDGHPTGLCFPPGSSCLPPPHGTGAADVVCIPGGS